MASGPCTQRLRVVVPQFGSLFRGEIFFSGGMEVFFHLFYNMFRLAVIPDLEVCRRFYHLMCMPALRAELPALEAIHVRKRPAGRAPDNEVHGNEVMRAIQIKIYRQFCKIQPDRMSSASRMPTGVGKLVE